MKRKRWFVLVLLTLLLALNVPMAMAAPPMPMEGMESARCTDDVNFFGIGTYTCRTRFAECTITYLDADGSKDFTLPGDIPLSVECTVGIP